MFGALLTTRIGDRYGWRAVCYCYAIFTAAFTVVWASLASDRPAPEFDHKKSANQPKSAKLSPQPPVPDTDAEAEAVTDREILLSKPSLALAFFHVAFNFLDQVGTPTSMCT